LTDAAFEVQTRLVHSSIRNFETFANEFPNQLGSPEEYGGLLVGLCRLSLEEMAAPDMRERLLRAMG
jgi:hypothetical protein